MKLTEDGQNIYINYGQSVSKDLVVIKDSKVIDFVVANDWGYMPVQLCVDLPAYARAISDKAFKRVDEAVELFISLPVGFSSIHRDAFSHFEDGKIELQFEESIIGFVCADDEFFAVTEKDLIFQSSKFINIADAAQICFNGKVREIILLNDNKTV